MLEKVMTDQFRRPKSKGVASGNNNPPNASTNPNNTNINVKMIEGGVSKINPNQKSTKDTNNQGQIVLRTSKAEFFKPQIDPSDICLCHKFDDDKINSLFNNNICRICGRNRLEKSIKKAEGGNLLRRSVEKDKDKDNNGPTGSNKVEINARKM
jgi:hypothetical protein